ncbi:Oligopeptide ABC transporter, periplasmic oligopeptide-binding protein OppA (TC 3.A.1.5.1) [hydrothermal vent metagenome]|uniref:Oligopeptide ABC transporter, periplasmic oligopeptide-binding protein OppA (TC 3.A.1.5.1) n=1 Tax=hydrothermal vent metagenome TaxID=652676 RepID=A0A3B0TSZ0_9ZZZZ
MSLSQLSKNFKRGLARNGLLMFSWAFERLPYSIVHFIMSIFLFIGYQFTIRQKRTARESLKIAFGDEKSDEEIKKIVKRCFRSFGEGMVEILYYMSHPEFARGKVVFEGKEYIDEAFKKGKGIVAVTAHFGNFPLMMLTCASEGYPVNSIIRPTRDKLVEEFLLKKRDQSGVHTVYAQPRKKCVSESLKVLRNNEMLFIPLDQNFGSSGGVFVDFFGQKAATATGPAVFASRTNAEVLLMFIIRQENGMHKIVVEPPFKMDETSSEEERVQVNIGRMTKRIEEYIRQYPHEWGWMHRRWKSKQSSG